MKVAAALLFFLTTAACSTAGDDTLAMARDAVPVQVWIGGDDGLTQRLAEAVRIRFTHTAHFRLSPSVTPDTLTVTIPTHVSWKKIGRRTQVRYQLRLERDDRHLGESSGVCWETDLDACAAQVVETALRTVS